jgi:hypothetical protein
MTAEFSLALDANTGLCVCPSHVNCYRHSVVPSAVTTTSICYAWVLRYGAKYVQLHQGTARAALWNETDQHLEGTPVPDGQIRGGLQVMDHNTRWVATNPFPNGAAGSGHKTQQEFWSRASYEDLPTPIRYGFGSGDYI